MTEGSIQVCYIVRTFINVTLYSQYNDNKKFSQLDRRWPVEFLLIEMKLFGSTGI
jgi:hypothetical protein